MEHNYKQHYAFNSKHELIHIFDATPETDNYFCVSCGEPMITKRGKIRVWHYAHKNNSFNCSFETYLHRVAKRRLCERYLQSEAFTVGFRVPYQCAHKETCCWSDDSYICNWDDYSLFDLKLFYGKSAEEQSYNGYRADVLLFNESEKYPPIFLEICVSHPCSKEKIESGVKIIELTIKNEADIEELLNADVIKESDKVKFHNFERKHVKSDPQRRKDIQKFILYENNKMFCSLSDCMTYMYHHPKAKIEVSVEYRSLSDCSMYDYGVAIASKIHPDLRVCNMCRYHGESISLDDWGVFDDKNNAPIFCKLYKKLGTKKYCFPAEAKTCSYYTPYTQAKRQSILRQFDKNYIWQKDKP